MTDETAQPIDAEAERLHQERSAEADLLVTQLLDSLRALGSHDRSLIIGAASALTRFTANAMARRFQPVGVRGILTTILPVLNHAAEQIVSGGLVTPIEPPKEGG